MAGRERSGPAQPGRAPLEHAGVQAERESRVPHAADVGRDEVPEVRAGGEGNVEDQISRVLGIPVDRAAAPLVAEADIDADVVRAGLLPVDELVDGAGADRGDELVAELHLRLTVAVRIGRVLQVVPERLVAGPGPGAAQLQLRERAEPLHEGLLRNPPRQRHRWEGAPLGTWAEARGTVTSRAQRGKVAVADVIVEPPEEGDELVVDDIPGVPNVRGRCNQWGTFPSVALAWRISQEPFMQG